MQRFKNDLKLEIMCFYLQVLMESLKSFFGN